MSNEEFQTLMINSLKDINSDIQQLKDGQNKLSSKLDTMEIKLDENTQIVRALEHKAEVNKAEHDSTNLNLAGIMGEIKELRNDFGMIEKVTINNWNQLIKIKDKGLHNI